VSSPSAGDYSSTSRRRCRPTSATPPGERANRKSPRRSGRFVHAPSPAGGKGRGVVKGSRGTVLDTPRAAGAGFGRREAQAVHQPWNMTKKQGLMSTALRPAASGRVVVGLVALGLGALVVRLGCARGDIWLDEIWSLDVVSRLNSAAAILTLRHDNNHPLN